MAKDKKSRKSKKSKGKQRNKNVASAEPLDDQPVLAASATQEKEIIADTAQGDGVNVAQRSANAEENPQSVAIEGKETQRDEHRSYLFQSGFGAINPVLMRHSASLLAVASGLGILIFLAAIGLDGGKNAVRAIGGFPQGDLPAGTGNFVFFLDTLFPIFYGAGLAVFATGIQMRGNRPLVRMILSLLLLCVVADLAENALIFAIDAGGQSHPAQWPISVTKYAGLAFAGVSLSALVVIHGLLGRCIHLLLRFVFPVAIGMLLSGIVGEFGRDIIAAGFPVSLILLSIYAQALSEVEQG